MVRFIRETVIKPGKFEGAVAFAKDISSYFEAAIGKQLIVCIQSGGLIGKISWHTDFENLGEIEAANKKLLADPKYLEKIRGVGDLFVEATTQDTYWSQI